ncbi:NADH-quinone oxidoreductase subunit M [Arcanobacterium pluranimalium]|uniref:NADH-quinone oxidoreductase subunit M n=1 Tax=Arcanobacterium pluranimalium TaxID=108028 RepID=UPI00195DB1CC|nr:NADH-quinone oxidoreductase subunit M [Arcanobacterium pluranimalium]MBM7825883.1 NADH-quinone oxidoreductase subunit M [Arcanobacterium pluranimalium]
MQPVIEATFPWLTTLVLLPLVGAILLAAIKPLRKAGKGFALAVSVLVLGLFLAVLMTQFSIPNAETNQLVETYRWIPQIGVSLSWALNGISAVMIALATFLVPVVILAAWNDFDDDRSGSYMAWILFLEAIMIALFVVRDVFVFYVLFELMIVPMYFLIGNYGGANRRRAAMKFLLYSILGGLIMLVGVIAVYVYGPGGKSGYMIDTLAQGFNASQSTQMWIFLSFFIAFAIKAPMWPVHTWLPDTTAEAPAGTSTLLVGVLDKLGTYGMIAICLPLFPSAANLAAPIIIALAIISIIWGALMAISSDDLMRLIAYTSVSHFGFMVIGIFSGSQLAMTGAILYMVAHGVGTAGLFLVVGFLGKRGGSYSIAKYGGWQRVTPVLAGTFLISGLATIALPGLSGFVPEYMVLVGTFRVNPVVAVFAVSGVVLAALYILLPYQRVFTGPRPELLAEDLNAREKLVMGLLICAMLVLGFYPNAVTNFVNPYFKNTVEQTISAPQFLDKDANISVVSEGEIK